MFLEFYSLGGTNNFKLKCTRADKTLRKLMKYENLNLQIERK